ncbi:polymorphic outer membrane protein [Planoprotostelium fungivorum]|uniref:Polymorphic outer membrane protein n=1 Tax=Planoprotostelium fungivorum TaxID=1890364 RepID=A0A2P6NPL5_9EUKA|nr:polymorphic outer membrane protein [Planoprotostelium fungivorum]
MNPQEGRTNLSPAMSWKLFLLFCLCVTPGMSATLVLTPMNYIASIQAADNGTDPTVDVILTNGTYTGVRFIPIPTSERTLREFQNVNLTRQSVWSFTSMYGSSSAIISSDINIGSQGPDISFSNIYFQNASIISNGAQSIQIFGCNFNAASKPALSIGAPSSVNISHSTFTNNVDSAGGSAISMNQGSLIISSSQFINNTCSQCGGAIFIVDVTLNISNSNFSFNSAASGGAICYGPASLSSSSLVTDSVFHNNTATTSGGGIQLPNLATFNLTSLRNHFTYNHAGVNGAGIYVQTSHLTSTDDVYGWNQVISTDGEAGGCAIHGPNGRMLVYGGLFHDNHGGRFGGAIRSTRLEVNSSIFINNSVGLQGGAILGDGGIEKVDYHLNIYNCSFYNNTAPNAGSAVHSYCAIHYVDNTTFEGNEGFSPHFVQGDTTRITNTRYINNVSPDYIVDVVSPISSFEMNDCLFRGNRGEIAILHSNLLSGTPLVSRSVFENNTMSSNGTLYVDDGRIVVSNSSFLYNVGNNSGAIYSIKSYVTVLNCTFYRNSAESGGAISFDSYMMAINSSHFEENQATVGSGGAINDVTSIENSPGFLSIYNSTFSRNQAVQTNCSTWCRSLADFDLQDLDVISDHCPSSIPTDTSCRCQDTPQLFCSQCIQNTYPKNDTGALADYVSSITSRYNESLYSCFSQDLSTISSTLQGKNYAEECKTFLSGTIVTIQLDLFTACLSRDITAGALGTILNRPSLIILYPSSQLDQLIDAVGSLLQAQLNASETRTYFSYVELISVAVLRNETDFNILSSPHSAFNVNYSFPFVSPNVSQIYFPQGSGATVPYLSIIDHLSVESTSDNDTITMMVYDLPYDPFQPAHEKYVNQSDIVGASIYLNHQKMSITNTSSNITIDITGHLQSDSECIHWSEDEELWSPDGCTRMGMRCLCNHLTNFTLGVSIDTTPSPSSSTPLVGLSALSVLSLPLLGGADSFRHKERMIRDFVMEEKGSHAIPSQHVNRLQLVLYDGEDCTIYAGGYQGSSVVMKYHKSKEALDRERYVLKTVRHPNIVQYFGYTLMEEKTYLILDHADVGSLEIYFEMGGVLSQIQIVQICMDISGALYYLEQERIVLNNLSIVNVLVNASEGGNLTVKVTNLSQAAMEDEHIRFSITETKEKGMERKRLHKPDVHSFGIFMWEVQHHRRLRVAENVTTPNWEADVYTTLATECFNMVLDDRPDFYGLNAALEEKYYALGGKRRKPEDTHRSIDLELIMAQQRQKRKDLPPAELNKLTICGVDVAHTDSWNITLCGHNSTPLPCYASLGCPRAVGSPRGFNEHLRKEAGDSSGRIFGSVTMHAFRLKDQLVYVRDRNNSQIDGQLLDATRIVEGFLVYQIEPNENQESQLGRVIFSLRELPEKIQFKTMGGAQVCRVSDIEVIINDRYHPIPRNHPPALATAPPAPTKKEREVEEVEEEEDITQESTSFVEGCLTETTGHTHNEENASIASSVASLVPDEGDLREETKTETSEENASSETESVSSWSTGKSSPNLNTVYKNGKEEKEKKKKKFGINFLRNSFDTLKIASPKKGKKVKAAKTKGELMVVGNYEGSQEPHSPRERDSTMSAFPSLTTRQKESLRRTKLNFAQ